VPEGGHAAITHNGPFRAGKGFLYEGGLRIPLIVRWPGRVTAGRVVDAPVTNLDWMPTLLEIAGLPPGTGLDGASLAPLLEGRGGAPERPFLWHFPHYTNQGGWPGGAVREGDWKLIEHYEDGRLELYDLARDPGEAEDQASREAARAKRLQGLLTAWRTSTGAQANTPNPGFDAALHRQLYLDVDMSRFRPPAVGPELRAAVQAWRRRMDGAVPRAPGASGPRQTSSRFSREVPTDKPIVDTGQRGLSVVQSKLRP